MPSFDAFDGAVETLALADRTDFYRAWKMMESAEGCSPAVAARAFAMWVALFGCVTDEGLVTRNSVEVAGELGVSRWTWTQYRDLLVDVGLMRRERTEPGSEPRTVIRLLPPLRSAT